MGLISKIDRHSTLFHRMSEARQVDLSDAVMHGAVDGQTLRDAVLRCMQCEQTDQCEHWLDEAGLGDTLEPTECRNRLLLDRLSV